MVTLARRCEGIRGAREKSGGNVLDSVNCVNVSACRMRILFHRRAFRSVSAGAACPSRSSLLHEQSEVQLTQRVVLSSGMLLRNFMQMLAPHEPHTHLCVTHKRGPTNRCHAFDFYFTFNLL